MGRNGQSLFSSDRCVRVRTRKEKLDDGPPGTAEGCEGHSYVMQEGEGGGAHVRCRVREVDRIECTSYQGNERAQRCRRQDCSARL